MENFAWKLFGTEGLQANLDSDQRLCLFKIKSYKLILVISV